MISIMSSSTARLDMSLPRMRARVVEIGISMRATVLASGGSFPLGFAGASLRFMESVG
jgi:hypothetical protein